MEVLQRNYDDLMAKGDSRTSPWFLMESPLPTVCVVAAYLVFVQQGRKYMADRKPFDLKSAIVVYNFCLVVLSAYMVVELILSAWTAPGFNLACQAVDYSNNPYSLRLAKVCWWFYFSKIVELMDTVFFVLRKKDNQISFLHVYHHSSMPLLWWVGVKFVGGGEAFFSSTLNSSIHTLMYSYYMLSAMGPAMQKYLWWKKYMTTLQLLQFWTVLFKTGYAVYLDCGYPVEYGYFLVGYMVSHILLFSNFYYQTYHKKAQLKKAEQNGQYDNNNQVKAATSANGTERARLRKQKRLD